MEFEGLRSTKHARSGGLGVGHFLCFATTNEEPIDGHRLHLFKETIPPSLRKPATASKRLRDSCMNNLTRFGGRVGRYFLIYLSVHESLQT